MQHAWHLDMQVDSVEQGAREAAAITLEQRRVQV